MWRGTEVAIKLMLEQDLTEENTQDFCNEISLLRCPASLCGFRLSESFLVLYGFNYVFLLTHCFKFGYEFSQVSAWTKRCLLFLMSIFWYPLQPAETS